MKKIRKKADLKRFIVGAIIFFIGLYVSYYLHISAPKFFTDVTGWIVMFIGACFIVDGAPE